jgi:hypothetical protein
MCVRKDREETVLLWWYDMRNWYVLIRLLCVIRAVWCALVMCTVRGVDNVMRAVWLTLTDECMYELIHRCIHCINPSIFSQINMSHYETSHSTCSTWQENGNDNWTPRWAGAGIPLLTLYIALQNVNILHTCAYIDCTTMYIRHSSNCQSKRIVLLTASFCRAFCSILPNIV